MPIRATLRRPRAIAARRVRRRDACRAGSKRASNPRGAGVQCACSKMERGYDPRHAGAYAVLFGLVEAMDACQGARLVHTNLLGAEACARPPVSLSLPLPSCMRSRIGESWRCALGLIGNATPCQCCNRAVPLVGRVWQCWSLHTL